MPGFGPRLVAASVALVAGIPCLASADERPLGGWDKKFFLTDGTDANRIDVQTLMQWRFMANFRRGTTGTDSDFTSGFELRRIESAVSGTVWSKDLSYKIQGEFGKDGTVALNDGFARLQGADGWAARVGQFKLPFLREELVSNIYQLTAERSVTNQTLTLARSQGIEGSYQKDRWRLAACFSDGRKANNTPFDKDAEADWALTARAEGLLAGENFKPFDDFTSFRGSGFSAMFGAAGHVQNGGHTNDTKDIRLVLATLDLSLEGDGWNGYAAAVYRSTDDATKPKATDDLAFLVQGGGFFSDTLEGFLRYDVVIPDNYAGADPFQTITAGINYFLSPNSHVAKFVADVVYFPNPLSHSGGVVSANSTQDLLPDTQGEQWGIRLQWQVVF